MKKVVRQVREKAVKINLLVQEVLIQAIPVEVVLRKMTLQVIARLSQKIFRETHRMVSIIIRNDKC
jgi:hypothetical protein